MTARQLHLFRSRRQRGCAPLSPSEYQLHCAVVDTVRRWIMPNWIYTHIASGEKRDPVTAARLKRMGVVSGFPDLVFFGPRRGLARAFLDTGAYLLGSRWKVNDKGAANFAQAFYEEMLAEEPFGRAVRKARHACKSSPADDFSWASYVYYGDPRIRFCRIA